MTEKEHLVKDITIETQGDIKMVILLIVTLMLAESTSEQQDSLIKYISHNTTIYVTTDDVEFVDTIGNRLWTFHLSEKKALEFDSLYYNQGEIFFFVNGTWTKLQEHEIRCSHIPIGYYIVTDFGKIEGRSGKVQIGYYKPPKKKKLNKIQRRLLYE